MIQLIFGFGLFKVFLFTIPVLVAGSAIAIITLSSEKKMTKIHILGGVLACIGFIGVFLAAITSAFSTVYLYSRYDTEKVYEELVAENPDVTIYNADTGYAPFNLEVMYENGRAKCIRKEAVSGYVPDFSKYARNGSN